MTDRAVADKGGRVAALAAGELGESQLVDELYLAVYARLPLDEERAILGNWIAQGAPQ